MAVPPDRDSVLEAIRQQVALRFRLAESDFADCVLALYLAPRRATDLPPPSALTLDDLYLATVCAQGDDDAWRELEATHFPFIYDFARRMLPGSASDDLASQVIADLWQRRKIAQYEGRSTLRTWLGAVVTRAALNVRSARASRGENHERHASRPAVSAASGAADAAGEDGRLLARLLVTALERVGDDRLLLLLYYEQGLTLEQIEPVLQVSKATLSRRLKRARARIFADVCELARVESATSIEHLRAVVDRAAFEFDLAEALRAGRQVQENGPRRV